MHVVARDWNPDLGWFLVQYGSPIDAPDTYGRTPLFAAVASGNLEMVKWFLDNGGKKLSFSCEYHTFVCYLIIC